MFRIAALFCGVLFGAGLAVSGMINPEKVLGFLDLAGNWDPTLAFVMGGALLVALPAFQLVLRRERPVLAPRFDLPTKRKVDARLVVGSAVFGVGWGLGGFCPGPAVAALVSGKGAVIAFVLAMFAGMALHSLVFEREGLAGSPAAIRGQGHGDG
ncbi:transporter [Rubrobacter xylanophilus]|uniref:Transporter n=1 Tax=Rubrobacter xylanophilus TaxID=49319 RepID=A0A510HGL4_9ACTN|nr:YeeE/YedE family protein [Rubrobacter xylanophilus]BBL79100.1 transporter [Rubrobacter xylanophilus]